MGYHRTPTGPLNSATAIPWSDGNDADFGLNINPTVNITVNGAQTVGNMTFDGGGYTVAGDALNLTGGNIAVSTANGPNTTAINSAIQGSAGLTLSGGGMLTLGGVNTYTGPTRITAGTLQMGTIIVPAAPPAGSVLEHDYTTLGLSPGNTVPNGTTINDISGSGNNGTFVGSSATIVAGPQGKQGINFNGSYSIVPYSPSIDINTWTTSMWVNVSSAANQTCLLDARYCTDSPYGCDEFYTPATGSFYSEVTQAGGGWICLSTNNLATPVSNGWHLFTTTFTTGAEQIYVDGNLLFTNGMGGTPALMTDNTDSLIIGSVNGRNFTMPIADYNTYNSVLTQGQIQTLYYGGVVGSVGALPATTQVTLATGAVFDLNGISQTVASVADDSPGATGVVTNNGSAITVLTLAPTGGSSAVFSGVIQDGANQMSLTINGSGTRPWPAPAPTAARPRSPPAPCSWATAPAPARSTPSAP